MSANVPAPTACALAPAPAARIRMMINSMMSRDVAHRTLNTIHNENEITNTVRRPTRSEAADHHNGNSPRASIYKATVKLTKFEFVFKPVTTYGKAGKYIEDLSLTIRQEDNTP